MSVNGGLETPLLSDIIHFFFSPWPQKTFNVTQFFPCAAETRAHFSHASTQNQIKEIKWTIILTIHIDSTAESLTARACAVLFIFSSRLKGFSVAH